MQFAHDTLMQTLAQIKDRTIMIYMLVISICLEFITPHIKLGDHSNSRAIDHSVASSHEKEIDEETEPSLIKQQNQVIFISKQKQLKIQKDEVKQEGLIFYQDSLFLQPSGDISESFGSLSIIEPKQEVQQEKQVQIYRFDPNISKYIKHFQIFEQTFKFISNRAQLVNIISKNPIFKHKICSIKFKIVRSLSKSIYIGLVNSLRLDKKSSARAKDNSTLSFHLSGKKRFYILNKSEEPKRILQIKNGDTIQMVINYEENYVIWLLGQVEMGVTQINFNGMDWYPFITMKNEGDIVQVY